MTALAKHWEEFHKQAGQIENEVEAQLVALSKLGNKLGSSIDFRDESTDGIPIERVLETMSKEIEQLLSKLSELNEKMENDNPDVGMGMRHRLQRHHEILRDYTREFQKTRSNIQATKDRRQLLGSTSFSKLNRRTDLYLKEHEHLRSSDRLIDEQIDVAIKTKMDLINQKNVLKALKTKVNTLTNNFPMINALIQKVQMKKARNSIILGTVIGICTILLIIYTFNK